MQTQSYAMVHANAITMTGSRVGAPKTQAACNECKAMPNWWCFQDDHQPKAATSTMKNAAKAIKDSQPQPSAPDTVLSEPSESSESEKTPPHAADTQQVLLPLRRQGRLQGRWRRQLMHVLRLLLHVLPLLPLHSQRLG